MVFGSEPLSFNGHDNHFIKRSELDIDMNFHQA